ncbi:MAG TPA: hypothetical protein VHA13_05255, partial [Gammaproteobacteria bacterium]|nr:hypothetical protein [Gammaproteobacteria bacterium]
TAELAKLKKQIVAATKLLPTPQHIKSKIKNAEQQIRNIEQHIDEIEKEMQEKGQEATNPELLRQKKDMAESWRYLKKIREQDIQLRIKAMWQRVQEIEKSLTDIAVSENQQQEQLELRLNDLEDKLYALLQPANTSTEADRIINNERIKALEDEIITVRAVLKNFNLTNDLLLAKLGSKNRKLNRDDLEFLRDHIADPDHQIKSWRRLWWERAGTIILTAILFPMAAVGLFMTMKASAASFKTFLLRTIPAASAAIVGAVSIFVCQFLALLGRIPFTLKNSAGFLATLGSSLVTSTKWVAESIWATLALWGGYLFTAGKYLLCITNALGNGLVSMVGSGGGGHVENWGIMLSGAWVSLSAGITSGILEGASQKSNTVGPIKKLPGDAQQNGADKPSNKISTKKLYPDSTKAEKGANGHIKLASPKEIPNSNMAANQKSDSTSSQLRGKKNVSIDKSSEVLSANGVKEKIATIKVDGNAKLPKQKRLTRVETATVHLTNAPRIVALDGRASSSNESQTPRVSNMHQGFFRQVIKTRDRSNSLEHSPEKLEFKRGLHSSDDMHYDIKYYPYI